MTFTGPESAQGWDLRTAVCRAASENLSSLEDDALMFLFQGASLPDDLNRVFVELYGRYRSRVCAWCLRFVRDPNGVDDLIQDIFLRAFLYRHTFRGESRLSTWLFTLARNRCMTVLRKSQADPLKSCAPLDIDLHGTAGFEPQHDLEREEKFSTMWRLIRTRLTPLEARVIELHFAHDLPLALITRQLGLTNPSGAKAYIVNAKRKLNAVLRTSRRLRFAA
ncbi:MAG: sigma-70 family RNA polymerase sigma factor [Acidobacteriota bacterium]|nr:sigma-70 family RNA polymerase sigma factor [Acidobacteriota bacterium]